LDAVDVVGLDGVVVVPLHLHLVHLDVGRPGRVPPAVDTDAVAGHARSEQVVWFRVRPGSRGRRSRAGRSRRSRTQCRPSRIRSPNR
jgi:hypothetical protein